MPPGATDPVEGMIDGVRIDLTALASLSGAGPLADHLRQLGRRLASAMQLLRWTDNREQMPWEGDDEPAPAAPAESPEDLEKTGDVAPRSGTDHVSMPFEQAGPIRGG
jgi:hypothetical protein